MKQTLFPFIFFLLLSLSSCQKKLGHDGLPQPTRTGAQTLGCRIDEKIFYNDAYFLSGRSSISSSYVYPRIIFASPTDTTRIIQAYHFQVAASNYKKDPLVSVTLVADSIVLAENVTYPIGSAGPGRAYATVMSFGSTGGVIDSTNDVSGGALVFTRVDTAAGILSGAFYFDVQAGNGGGITHVTDGRFDVKYSK